MPNYEREFSNFPEKKIERHHYKNMTPEVSNIFKEIDNYRKNKNYTKAQELIKQNSGILKPYVFDAVHFRTLEEEIYNTQVFASQRQQLLHFGTDNSNCQYNDIWVTDYEALIPAMTSYNAPSGLVRCGCGDNTNFEAYRAFDRDDTTLWTSANSDFVAEGYLIYEFENPVDIAYLTCLIANANSEPSSSSLSKYPETYDATLYFDFFDISGNKRRFSYDMLAGDIENLITFRLPSKVYNITAMQMSFSNKVVKSNSYTRFRCQELQVYGSKNEPIVYDYEPLIPIMTSSSEPVGKSSCGSYYGSNTLYYSYRAFDGSYDTCWRSDGASYAPETHYLKYQFPIAACVDRIVFVPTKNSGGFSTAYETTVYFDLETLNEIITVEQVIAPEDMFRRFTIQLDNIVEDVFSITMRFSNAMRNGDASDSDYEYCTCAELQTYGYYKYEELIPNMSARSNKTTGYVLCDSNYSSTTQPNAAFSKTSTYTFNSKGTTQNHYLQYNFYDEKTIKYITYQPLKELPAADSTTYSTVDNTIYIDFLDKEGNILYTETKDILAAEMANELVIYLSNEVYGVWSVKLRGTGGYSSASENYNRLTCYYMNMYGSNKPIDSTYTALIPTMTSLTKPEGTVTTSNAYDYGWGVFNVDNVNQQWSEKTTGADAYIQYEFANAVNIKYIEHMAKAFTTTVYYFHEVEVYFDLLDEDGNLIETLSYSLDPNYGYYKHRIESEHLIENVKFIRCRYSGSFVTTSSTATPNYVYCALIQAYGTE